MLPLTKIPSSDHVAKKQTNTGRFTGIILLLISTICPVLRAVAPRTDWVRSGVFYEIYPQTFMDSNGDGIGDLKGITGKLQYVKSLGVTAIWLNPFYESSFRDAGYDVTDYYSVAKRYGTNQDARELFLECHRQGLKVIIDFVPGHTSIDHPWFKESAKPGRNKYTNWYVWTSGTWFSGVDRNQYTFIQGYSERDGCYLTNFFWHQPALNYGSTTGLRIRTRSNPGSFPWIIPTFSRWRLKWRK
jgi:hypothetical protein